MVNVAKVRKKFLYRAQVERAERRIRIDVTTQFPSGEDATSFILFDALDSMSRGAQRFYVMQTVYGAFHRAERSADSAMYERVGDVCIFMFTTNKALNP